MEKHLILDIFGAVLHSVSDARVMRWEKAITQWYIDGSRFSPWHLQMKLLW